MPKTDYISDLDGEQIEAALEAIHDVVTPSNNGKVLCISGGKIAAKSASEWGGGGYPEPTGTIQITANGTVNVKDYASADVHVPNGITAADEGKVVKNGALVAQTARATAITANGTYDTTENNSVTVNVSGGGGGAVVQPLSVTQNGTYNPPSGVDGYAPVTVNVSGGDSTHYVYSRIGTGAYIDTGVPCNTEDLKVVGQIKFNNTNDRSVFGGAWSAVGFFLLVYNNSIRWHTKGVAFDVPANEVTYGMFSTDNIIECTKDYIKVNGHEHQVSGSGANVSDNLKIFGFRSGYSAECGFSSLKLYQGDTLIRDFVPDFQNNAACFYDRVSGQYYFNVGSGDLYYS